MLFLFCRNIPTVGSRRGVVVRFLAFQKYPSATALISESSMQVSPMLSLRGSHLSPLSQKLFSSSSSSDNDDVVVTKSPRRRRRRHNFDLDRVPSFEAFQQQQNIRSLYRSFLRLAYGSSSRDELVKQVRHEFRQGASSDDPWTVKRAISDGGKRYKELSAMLSNVPGGKNEPNAQETKNRKSSTWPWQSGKLSSKPLSFPKR